MKINFTKGFTLIETLVAITILMISIVGPLTIASKGLAAAVVSKDQVVGSYLAQDMLEELMHVRDNDILDPVNNGGWTKFLSDTSSCTGSTGCGLETAPGVAGTGVSCAVNGCKLYMDYNVFFYTYNTTSAGHANIPTEFTRSYTVTPLSPGGTTDAALVKVTVSWKNGTVTSNVVLNSLFFNTLR